MANPGSPSVPHKPPFRRRGAVALDALVPDAVAAVLRERGFASSAILTDWREIVGPHLSQWTSPIEIRWPRRPAHGAADKNTTANKRPPSPPSASPAARGRDDKAARATLVIACPGAFALDVQMSSQAIIAAVNRRLGFGCIGALQIHQAPRPEPEPAPVRHNVDPETIRAVDATLADIEHGELRETLARLGAEITARTRK